MWQFESDHSFNVVGNLYQKMHFAGSNLSTDSKCPKCIYKISKNFRVERFSEIFTYGECEIMCYRTLWNIAPCSRNVKWNKSPHAPQRISHAKRISRTKCISQIPQGIYFVEKSTCDCKCFFLAPPAGLEPATTWLTVRCSTYWAKEECIGKMI